ncbi:MAG: putative glycoside hydrolase, partial [Acidimicrobiia bacterium]
MIRRLALPFLVVCLVSVGLVPAGAAGRLTGQVVSPTGVPLADVVVKSGGVSTVTDGFGRFLLEGVAGGEVSLSRVAYQPRTVTWDGDSDWLTIPLVPRVVRGLHVAGWVAADPVELGEILDLVESTAVNAVIVDVKNENGRVYHDSNVPIVALAGSAAEETFDMAAVAARAHAAGAYVITRIVSFQDPIVAPARPSWSVIDRTTGQPFNQKGQRFLDPWDAEAREFVLALAEEVCRAGVDEIQ